MNDNERGMKKWAPFSALIEQEEILNKMMEKKYESKDTEISEDQIYEIEYLLNNYHNQELIIQYFDNDFKTLQGKIDKIDTTYQTLRIGRKIIKINSIKSIKEL